MSDFHSFSVLAHAARVELHRPPVNDLNRESGRELTLTARMLERRREVWLIPITSPLQTFCAGADLRPQFDHESSCYAPLLRTEDRREALKAFLEK